MKPKNGADASQQRSNVAQRHRKQNVFLLLENISAIKMLYSYTQGPIYWRESHSCHL